MALFLRQQVETNIPIEVSEITPDRLRQLNDREIAKLKIWHGSVQIELDRIFEVSGSLADDLTIVFQGDLLPVHWIGAGMKAGTIRIDSDCGRHVGSQMQSGEIIIEGNASDFLGVEMTGGLIRISGNVGDHAGAAYPGSKTGMNRGAILINGNAGNGLGQSLRRGTIAVRGSSGDLTGWNMTGGTILVMEKTGEHAGAGMTRGTLILGSSEYECSDPTFRRGGLYTVPVIPVLAKWLRDCSFDMPDAFVHSRFREFNGDILKGGRGELFVRHVG